jgi:shikimate kinase
MNYFICGFSGAGKSYLLKLIEQSYHLSHYHFIDLDFLIDQKYAAEFDNIGAMIESIGMEAFRLLELNEIKDLADKKNVFLALGGGALTQKTQALLSSWTGLWLDTNFEKCFERIKNDRNRPLVKAGKDCLKKLYQERLANYKQYQRVEDLAQVLEITKPR